MILDIGDEGKKYMTPIKTPSKVESVGGT